METLYILILITCGCVIQLWSVEETKKKERCPEAVTVLHEDVLVLLPNSLDCDLFFVSYSGSIVFGPYKIIIFPVLVYTQVYSCYGYIVHLGINITYGYVIHSYGLGFEGSLLGLDRRSEIISHRLPRLGGKRIRVAVFRVKPTQSCALLCEEHMGQCHRIYYCLRKYSRLLPSSHGPPRQHNYDTDSQNRTSRPERRTGPSHRGPDWRLQLLENSILQQYACHHWFYSLWNSAGILTGNWKGITANQMKVNHITLEQSDSDLRRFWDLETLGITPSQEWSMFTGDSQILQEFHRSYRIEDDRRVVRLPKEEIFEPSPNHGMAKRRFRTPQKQLQKDDALTIIYEEQMLDHAAGGKRVDYGTIDWSVLPAIPCG